MDNFFTLIAEPAVLIGVLVGLAVAAAFNWFAPAGTDTVTAGAWFVGLGAVGGLIWNWVYGKSKWGVNCAEVDIR